MRIIDADKLVERLRVHAELAEANEPESLITLLYDMKAVADLIEQKFAGIDELKPCPFCSDTDNGFIRINDTVEYSGIEMCMNRQGMFRVRVYDESEHFGSQDSINIKYCPFCGRSFK